MAATNIKRGEIWHQNDRKSNTPSTSVVTTI